MNVHEYFTNVQLLLKNIHELFMDIHVAPQARKRHQCLSAVTLYLTTKLNDFRSLSSDDEP